MQHQGKKKKQHLMKKVSVGLPDDTIRVKIMSDNEDYTAVCLAECSCSFEDDSVVFNTPGHSTDEESSRAR
eukprot:2181971-Ditylum_brightwellii.AAC.1